MHRVVRNVPAISYTLWSVVFPSGVSGQVAVTPASPTPMGGLVALGIIVGLLVLVGIGVKVYDIKRKREEQGVALQARLSDALLESERLSWHGWRTFHFHSPGHPPPPNHLVKPPEAVGRRA